MAGPLDAFFSNAPKFVALTGAGISAASGIPTYRNDNGEWQRSEPIQHRDFLEKEAARRRYWARSMAGWPYVADSAPNAAHHALAAMEKSGHLSLVSTQNVDGLHQRAGHRNVVDLHGRIDQVKCLACKRRLHRGVFQQVLTDLNPAWSATISAIRPDGDAEVEDSIVDYMTVPDCDDCGGVLMPDVVFFGGTVPRERVDVTRQAIEDADALLVAGSSLKIFSGYRFVRMAHELGKPIAIVNRGETRGDHLADVKVSEDAGEVLAQLASSLGSASDTSG
jgi:NAD-dependent SIR2 family protein deacetylase